MELLIAHGADPAAANDDGMTVLSMAEEERERGRRRPRPRPPLGSLIVDRSIPTQLANANSCATESHGFPRPNVTPHVGHVDDAPEARDGSGDAVLDRRAGTASRARARGRDEDLAQALLGHRAVRPRGEQFLRAGVPDAERRA